MMSRYPDELRADFQQYYGLNIDGMGADYSVTHAAVLAVMLPLGARVPSKADPSLEWSLDRQLAAATANAVRDLHWAMAGGGEADRPERIGPPAQAGGHRGDIRGGLHRGACEVEGRR